MLISVEKGTVFQHFVERSSGAFDFDPLSSPISRIAVCAAAAADVPPYPRTKPPITSRAPY